MKMNLQHTDGRYWSEDELEMARLRAVEMAAQDLCLTADTTMDGCVMKVRTTELRRLRDLIRRELPTDLAAVALDDLGREVVQLRAELARWQEGLR